MQTTTTDPHRAAISAMRKRLARWELDHLRQLAASQEEQLSAAHDRIEILETEAARAWDMADAMRDDISRLIEELAEAGKQVGLTVGGQLVAMPTQGAAA